MFDNIGSKIKTLAKVVFWVEAVIAVIVSLALLDATEGLSLLYSILGVLAALITAWFLYGFGEIIDKLCQIEKNTRSGDTQSDTQSKSDLERLDKIEKLRAEGLITEEEYQKAISKE